MDAIARVHSLDGATIAAASASAWGPTGALRVANVRPAGDEVVFDLLVPTSANDFWDYIWSSEQERQTTDKVQLFQAGVRVPGSRITAIAREGEDPRWSAKGPERYRLTFTVPAADIKADTSLEVRFFWQQELMSRAVAR